MKKVNNFYALSFHIADARATYNIAIFMYRSVEVWKSSLSWANISPPDADNLAHKCVLHSAHCNINSALGADSFLSALLIFFSSSQQSPQALLNKTHFPSSNFPILEAECVERLQTIIANGAQSGVSIVFP